MFKQRQTFGVLFWLTFRFFFFQCSRLTIIVVDVGLRASLIPVPLTDHHEAGLIVERRPVGVNKRLLQLLQVYEAAVVWVNTLEPLVGLWVHARGDVTCNWMEPKINKSRGKISEHPRSENVRKPQLVFRKSSLNEVWYRQHVLSVTGHCSVKAWGKDIQERRESPLPAWEMGIPSSENKILQEKKGAEERRCKGRVDCQKNEWRNRDRRHFRPNLDGFCPCGDCRQHKLSGSDLGLAFTRNSVISHTHTHVCALTHTHICLILCLPLTQYYPAHHSSHVILLRDTNWTPSQHGCQGTWVIFYPSLHRRVSEKGGGKWKSTIRAFLQSPCIQNKPVHLQGAPASSAALQPVRTCRGLVSIVSSLRLTPITPIRPARRPSGPRGIRPSLTWCSVGACWWLSCIWSWGVMSIRVVASIGSTWWWVSSSWRLVSSSWIAL